MGRQLPAGFHVSLADELVPMPHKCVAGGCSRARRQQSLLHFPKGDSLKKRWPAAIGRVHCIFLCLVRLSRKFKRLSDCN